MMRARIGAVLLVVALCFLLPATAIAGTLKILPEAGRADFLKAFAEARVRIRIEICVLEDPQILAGLQQAIQRGVRVQVIVDNGKYQALPSEQTNLANYIVASGGELHLSNPIFPRSFPKVILIDDRQAHSSNTGITSLSLRTRGSFAISRPCSRMTGAIQPLSVQKALPSIPHHESSGRTLQ